MYHQFKQLADIDITREPMEVGPTTHYMMGGLRVDGDTQMTTLPGLFAAGESAAGLHGANRLGGNSLSDLLVFGQRAGHHAALHASTSRPGQVDPAQVERAAQRALAPFDRAATQDGESPYAVQQELQALMQDKVGIVRTQSEMEAALEAIRRLQQRSQRVTAPGNREYNAAWHTALDLPGMLVVAEAIALAAIARRESRGAHFREDFPGKDDGSGRASLIVRKGQDGHPELRRQPLPEIPPELRRVIEEMG
jgi:succinate dehydrogenase / fumarate reductase flavoprotein subunit